MEITDAISLLIDSGFKVVPHRVEGWWKDTGKPEDILEANHLILDMIQSSNEGKVEDGASVVGLVLVSPAPCRNFTFLMDNPSDSSLTD